VRRRGIWRGGAAIEHWRLMRPSERAVAIEGGANAAAEIERTRRRRRSMLGKATQKQIVQITRGNLKGKCQTKRLCFLRICNLEVTYSFHGHKHRDCLNFFPQAHRER
jgi:hypothetical protein